MAAGLYIHILDEIDDGHAGILNGSADAPFLDLGAKGAPESVESLARRLGESDRVFVGEGPWGADEATAHPLPAPLARIRETVAPGPLTVDEQYIARIMIPFDRHDESPYRLGRPGEIWRFLRHHQGKQALLAVHPEEVAAVAEPVAAPDADGTAAATAPAPEAPPEPPLEPVRHDPAFRRAVPTIDGVRPLALVLVTTQQRAPGSMNLRERIFAALATIGTFGAGLAAGAGLNNLIR